VTTSDDRKQSARKAGRDVVPLLKRLLACIMDVEADGWDTDWVRLPRRYASAVLTDIEADLIDPMTATEAAHRVELLGSELALRRWVAGDAGVNEFDAAAGQLLGPLSKYRGLLRALSSGEPAT
jgi:hypothetical protein